MEPRRRSWCAGLATAIARARPWLPLVLALMASSCVVPATEVICVIDTDLPASTPLTIRVTARIGSAVTGESSADRTWTRSDGDGGFALPASFAITPAPGQPHDGDVTLVVEATSGERTVRRIARFRFVPGRAMELPIFLTARCAAQADRCEASVGACTMQGVCEAQGETCGNDGSCIAVDAVLLDRNDASAPSGTCGAGSDCCDANTVCAAGTICTTGGVCAACGAGSSCCNDGTTCPNGFMCDASGTRCAPCGSPSEPCCARNRCNGSSACMGGTCIACGSAGAPCCAGRCNAGLSCSGGTCRCTGLGRDCSGGETCCSPNHCGSTSLGTVCCAGQGQPCTTSPECCGSLICWNYGGTTGRRCR